MARNPKGGFDFQARPRVAGRPAWAGMVTEGDPGSIPRHAFSLVRNFRWEGGGLVTKPGVTELAEVTDAIWLLDDFHVTNPRRRLWLSISGCAGAAIGTGSRLIHFDPEQDPAAQVYANFFAQADRQSPEEMFDGDLYVGNGSLLCKIIVVTPPPGVAVSDYITTPVSVPVHEFVGYNISFLKSFDGKLFIGLENVAAPASSRIGTWDGLSIKDNDITGVRPPLVAHIFRGNKLVVGFDATAAHIRVRDLGATPGTWTTVALAGFLASPFQNSMREYGPLLYIASGNDLIHSFNGTALALAHTVAGTDVAGFGVTSLVVHDEIMYYGWNEPGPDYFAWLGKFDRLDTTLGFRDGYLDLTNGVAGDFIGVTALESFKRSIYIGGAEEGLLATNHEDVNGTLTRVYPAAGTPTTVNFPIRQLLVY